MTQTASIETLSDIARALVAPGKGILAADESTGTIKRRFDSIGAESTETNRRDYREMLFRTPDASEFISGVILYDETIRQRSVDGTPIVSHHYPPGRGGPPTGDSYAGAADFLHHESPWS